MNTTAISSQMAAPARIKIALVGFGEVNSPRDLIERKCAQAQKALEAEGLDIVTTAPISDDPAGADEARARRDLAGQDFELMVVCLAGWIPSHTVIDVISPWIHKPMALWGLTGYYENGRLVTTADQAGTSALRDPMDALGFRFKYFYDIPDEPFCSAPKIRALAEVIHAANRLKTARVGMMGYRDMRLYATLVDGVSLRRVVGTEVDVFETLEIVQRMERQQPADIQAVSEHLLSSWQFDQAVDPKVIEAPVRMYLALMEKVRERGYQSISLIDVDGVKKLLNFPPGLVLSLLADQGGVASIPENDGLGAVTQLIVRFLTGQVGAYFEFYEFFNDRVLMGVPDFVPAEVVDGPVHARLAKFGSLADGLLNISKIKTGKVTLCRLASRGDAYRMHIATGEAVTPRKWEEAGWDQPAPQLPGLEILLDTPVEEFTQKVLGQHYILAYGDYRKPLMDLCWLLGISVI